MPRIYKPDPTKKRYKKYDPEIMKRAVEEYISGNKKLGEVAKKYDISRSVLYRHSTCNIKRQGGQRSLSDEAENYLIDNINKFAERGHPLDTMDLRCIVKMYLDKIGVTHKRFKNNFPGPDFINNFLQRHESKISQRVLGNIGNVRAKVCPNTIREYFGQMEKCLDGVPASNILNYDEINLSDDPSRKKILTRRGCTDLERINRTKTSVTIMVAGSADGTMLPPYLVYKATHLYDTWVEQGPNGARYNRSDSGWFDETTFQDWVESLVFPFFKNVTGRKYLIGNNLLSHPSDDLVQKCEEHSISFIFLPGNSTHLTQPLEVAFSRPMKRSWRQLLVKWKETDGQKLSTVPRRCFPKLLKLLLDDVNYNSSNNIIAAFNKTGIIPLDISQILARLPDEEQDSNDQIAEADSVLKLLREMRDGSINATDPERNQILNVISGKMEDFTESDTSDSNS